MHQWINTLRPRQNGRHFADDIFKCIFLNENVWIPIKISLKFVPKGPIINIPALVQIMVWRRPGDKPLSESMMVSLPTYTCVTRPQWVKLEAFRCQTTTWPGVDLLPTCAPPPPPPPRQKYSKALLYKSNVSICTLYFKNWSQLENWYQYRGSYFSVSIRHSIQFTWCGRTKVRFTFIMVGHKRMNLNVPVVNRYHG